jgi:hypothetical protein
MPGPAQPWDLPEDPRDQTVDLPRIDPISYGNGGPRPGDSVTGPSWDPHGPGADLPGHLPDRNGHGPAITGPRRRLGPPGRPEPPGQIEPPTRRGQAGVPDGRDSAGRQGHPAPDSSRDPYAVPGQSARPGLLGPAPPPPASQGSGPDLGRGEPSPRPEPAAGRESPAAASAQPPAPPAQQLPAPPEPAERAEPSSDAAALAPPAAPPQGGTPSARRVGTYTRGRPPAGSLADLRLRLDRLPDGHPSSPYEDGGTPRALPHRLRQLELGLPAPERDQADGTGRPDLAASLPAALDRLEATSVAADSAGDVAASGHRQESSAPADAANAAADGPRRALPADRSRAGGSPAGPPGSWQDPYAVSAPANGHSGRRGTTDGDLSLEPWPTDASVAEPQPGQSPPRLADPRADSPEDDRLAPPPGPAQDPPGPQADHDWLVARMVAASRAAEGQTVFGSYGASGLTPVIRRLAAQLEHGGLAPGSEADSLKSAERLSAKLTRLAARHPDCTAAELATGIGDAVRYAFAFQPEHYTEGTWLVHRKLKAQGFELEARRNRWESPEYKGVWTRWHDPAHDLAFEVQFHTFASWDVMQRTYQAYLLITDPATAPAERARLRARQVAVAAAAQAPPNCAEIAEFGRGAR